MSRTSTAEALAGVKIVSLAVNLPGPLAAARLASMAIERHFAERLADAVGGTRDEMVARFATESAAHWVSLGRSAGRAPEPTAVQAQLPPRARHS